MDKLVFSRDPDLQGNSLRKSYFVSFMMKYGEIRRLSMVKLAAKGFSGSLIRMEAFVFSYSPYFKCDSLRKPFRILRFRTTLLHNVFAPEWHDESVV